MVAEARLAAVVVMLALVWHAPALRAQSDSAARHRFWVGIGAGAGSATGTCGGCVDEGTRGGTTFHASVGGGVSERLTLALEPSVWIAGAGAVSQTEKNEVQRGDLALVAYLYPRPARETFVQVGAGFAGYRSTVGTPVRNASGVAAVFGVGHGWRVARSVVVRGSVAAHFGWLGEVREDYETGGSHVLASHATQRVLAIEITTLLESEPEP